MTLVQLGSRPVRSHPPRRLEGQTIVLFALMSVVLLGMLGLALDVGYDYSQRRTMQNAADAAALAGTQAVFGGSGVYTAVLSSAQANGLHDENLLECRYINNAGTYATGSTCKDSPVPGIGLGISGVEVKAGEQHRTFVMRVLGAVTSGTAAKAAAQIQIPIGIPNGIAPFLPCGADTTIVDANGSVIGHQSIMETQGYYLYTASTARQTYLATVEYGEYTPPHIQDSMYSYRWPKGPNDAGYLWPNSPLGPRFLIHDGSGSKGITRCDLDGYAAWKGVNLNDTGDITLVPGGLKLPPCDIPPTAPSPAPVYPIPNYNCTAAANPPPGVTAYGGVVVAGTGDRAGPSADAPGIGGCQTQQANNCIMVLPIVDNSYYDGGNGSKGKLAARTWGAFYVQSNNSGNSTYGYLIKDYNYTGAGGSMATWNPNYKGVIAIKLIR